MNYKYLLLIVAALLLDLSLGVFFFGVAPIFLIIVILIIALKLGTYEALILGILSGLLYDMSQISSSFFYAIFLPAEIILLKYLGGKVLDFSSKATQLFAVCGLLLTRTIIYYLIYDRSVNSVLLKNNLLAISIIGLLFTLGFLISRSYVKKI